MTDTAVIVAPAKLTLRLHITGVRRDGYHLIDAEMVTLQLADSLEITPGGSGLTADGPFADGLKLDDSNLVARALRFAGRRAGVHLRKVIPHGGGLGDTVAPPAQLWLDGNGCCLQVVGAVAARSFEEIPHAVDGRRADDQRRNHQCDVERPVR